MVASFSLILGQPPSVIENECYKKLAYVGLLKEYESEKMEEEMKKSKRGSGKSAIKR